jgi:hypothetical protein
MRDHIKKDREGDTWLVVEQDSRTTVYRLVEVADGGDVLRQARDLHVPAVMVDVALPPLPALDGTPGVRRRSARSARSAKSRLIHLNVRTVTGDDATGAVVWRKEATEARSRVA